MGILRKTILFAVGGGTYVAVELMWRGRSHYTMFLAGGTCFLLLGQLNKAKPSLQLPLRGFVGAGVITMVELAAGLLVNRQYKVWDYRNVPFNFLGQVCLPFFLLWVPLSLGAMGLYQYLEELLDKDLRPLV